MTRDDAVLALLREAARLGLPCPSNAALCAEFGWRSEAAPAQALRRLERRGLIHVTRFMRGRVVVILAGPSDQPQNNAPPGPWRTARPACLTPHWSAA